MIGDILQPTHLLFILVIALLVLGPKRLPEVGRSLGRGLRDFRNALSGDEPDRHEEIVSQSVVDDHPVNQPAVSQPATSQPAVTQPTTTQPAATQPVVAEPPAHPVGSQPNGESAQPASEPAPPVSDPAQHIS